MSDAHQTKETMVRGSGISRVFILCNAYESGIGHGLQADDLANPYTPGTDEHEAYNIGYEQGRHRAARSD